MKSTVKPSRRTFIKGTAAATTAAVVGFPAIVKAATYELKMASLAPKGSSWAKAFDAVARLVSEQTGGEMKIRTYYGGSMGDEGAMVRKVRTGQLDAVAVTNVGLGEINKQLLMLQLPLLFKNYDQLDKVRAHMQPKFDKMLADAGFVAGGNGDVGFNYLFSNNPIRVPDDVKSTKMWVWTSDPVSKEIMKVAGVNGIPLDVPDVLPSLQTGIINAFGNSPYGAIALQWYTKAAYITDLKLGMTIGGTVISKKSWDALPTEMQQILKNASMAVHDKLIRRIRQDNKDAMKVLVEKGIEVVAPEDFAAWKKVADTVRTNLTGSLFDKALVDEMMALL